MANHTPDLHFRKTEIFLPKGLDKPQLQGRSDLPDGQNHRAFVTPVVITRACARMRVIQ
jgi:hypothetical protein